MLTSHVGMVFTAVFNWAVFAAGAVYTGLVLMNYRTSGPHYRPRIDIREPARSAERLLVWLGVKALSFAMQLGTPVFGMLAEASADVGEWYLRHSEHKTTASYRSRFMV